MFKEINLRNHSSLHKLFYSLEMKVEEDNYVLPLLEVTKTDNGKLEIWNDQDSYYVSQKLRLPVRYYYSYRPENQRLKSKQHLTISESEIEELVRYCWIQEVKNEENH